MIVDSQRLYSRISRHTTWENIGETEIQLSRRCFFTQCALCSWNTLLLLRRSEHPKRGKLQGKNPTSLLKCVCMYLKQGFEAQMKFLLEACCFARLLLPSCGTSGLGHCLNIRAVDKHLPRLIHRARLLVSYDSKIETDLPKVRERYWSYQSSEDNVIQEQVSIKPWVVANFDAVLGLNLMNDHKTLMFYLFGKLAASCPWSMSNVSSLGRKISTAKCWVLWVWSSKGATMRKTRSLWAATLWVWI